jgi:hypothetical protein
LAPVAAVRLAVFPGREGGREWIFARKTDSRVLTQEDLLVKYAVIVDARIDAPYSICALAAVCALHTHPIKKAKDTHPTCGS